MVIIMESYEDYGEKVPTPQNDIDGGISNPSFRMFLKAHNTNMMNYFKMNLFWAALMPDLRSQQEQENMTIWKMYHIITMAQREGKNFKRSAIVNAVKEEQDYEEPETNETDVASFRCQSNTQNGAQPKTGTQGNANKGYQNQGRGGQQAYNNFITGRPGVNFMSSS
jgi:hypothetical protein